MIKFKQYLLEKAEPAGNYVCIKAEDQERIFERMHIAPPKTGVAPPNGDYHCTLIYSKETDVNPKRILESIHSTGLNYNNINAEVDCFECFDSLPEEGSRDAAKSCLVMKLKSNELLKLNDHLRQLGLNHSYAEYSPHITLYYNMSVDEAHYFKDMMNVHPEKFVLNLSGIKSETINKDYV